MAGQETEVPGKDGLLYPRTIYHLQQDRAVCLLDLREFCKVRAVSSPRTAAVPDSSLLSCLCMQDACKLCCVITLHNCCAGRIAVERSLHGDAGG